jgi:hypothetical protein
MNKKHKHVITFSKYYNVVEVLQADKFGIYILHFFSKNLDARAKPMAPLYSAYQNYVRNVEKIR